MTAKGKAGADTPREPFSVASASGRRTARPANTVAEAGAGTEPARVAAFCPASSLSCGNAAPSVEIVDAGCETPKSSAGREGFAVEIDDAAIGSCPLQEIREAASGGEDKPNPNAGGRSVEAVALAEEGGEAIFPDSGDADEA